MPRTFLVKRIGLESDSSSKLKLTSETESDSGILTTCDVNITGMIKGEFGLVI